MSADWLGMLWPWALLVVAAYCLVQIVRDCRARSYVMAGVGGICLVLLALTPIQTRAVKLDVHYRDSALD